MGRSDPAKLVDWKDLVAAQEVLVGPTELDASRQSPWLSIREGLVESLDVRERIKWQRNPAVPYW